MLSVDRSHDPLLKRPLSIHYIKEDSLQFLYRVQGRGTSILSMKKEGDVLELLGPLGNSFPIQKKRKKIMLAAGGIGIAPIYYLAYTVRRKGPVLFYGARDEHGLVLLKEIEKMNIDLRIATDDGSIGKKGNVVDLITEYLGNHKVSAGDCVIHACGPEPMLRALAALGNEYGIPCYAALESHMACGVGTCLGCVVRTKSGFKRVCKEGPVFNLNDIDWDSA